MEELEICGKIRIGDEWDQLYIGEDTCKALGEWDWEVFDGKIVTVRYYISDEELKTIELAEEEYIKQVYGKVDVDVYPLIGTEWTGQYGFEQELKVGGHDLIEEMREHEGKYIALEVTTSKPKSVYSRWGRGW